MFSDNTVDGNDSGNRQKGYKKPKKRKKEKIVLWPEDDGEGKEDTDCKNKHHDRGMGK